MSFCMEIRRRWGSSLRHGGFDLVQEGDVNRRSVESVSAEARVTSGDDET